jgi:hypothetical protein
MGESYLYQFLNIECSICASDPFNNILHLVIFIFKAADSKLKFIYCNKYMLTKPEIK